MKKNQINSFEQLAKELEKIIIVDAKSDNDCVGVYINSIKLDVQELKSIFSRINFNYNGRPKQSDNGTNV